MAATTTAPVEPKVETKPAYVAPVAPDCCVGEPGILWFAHGDKSQTGAPCAVTEVCKGVLTVTVFARLSQPFTKIGVRHIDDPFLKSHQSVMIDSGAWDYCESKKQEMAARDRRKPKQD